MFQDWFDSIVCINLDRRTDRWSETQVELKRCGITKCQRFSAFDHPVDKSAGCATSHREVWDRVGSGALGDRVLVLEDDVHLVTPDELRSVGFTEDSAVWRIFSEPAYDTNDLAVWLSYRFAVMVEQLPMNWDALYLGGSYERKPFERVAKHVIRTAGMHTTHAYALTRSAAGQMTLDLDAKCPRSEYPGGIDSILCGYAQAMSAYVLSPRLFIQRPSKSDINPDASLGFPWSQTDPTHELMV